jgi:hypothetical protein
MQLKGIIQDYSNSALPLSRKEIAKFISDIDKNKNLLSGIEQKILEDLKIEFEFDLTRTSSESVILLDSNNLVHNLFSFFTDKEKFLYSWNDSSNSLFMEGLLSSNNKYSNSDIHKKATASLYSWGGRLRGTIDNSIGYYLLATNGQVFGNKEFALEDPQLRGNYKINENNGVNFDLTEGYISYLTNNLNFEIGRERISIGPGIMDRMIVSSKYTSYDFIKASIKLGNIKYLFLHSWLLGKKVQQPVINDDGARESKYLALHRFEISLFAKKLNLAFSEMIIYGNRAPEIIYMTPLIFYKSAEHSLWDRDNSLIAFDFSSNCLPSTEIYGTFLIDDINFSKLGTKWWGNLFSYQGGIMISDPLNIKNLDLVIEYLREDPYTFTHRIYNNNYTNNIYPIGPDLDPNSDKISFLTRYYFNHRLNLGISYSFTRHGANIIDQFGNIINYGGDIEIGHRPEDSENTTFLAGNVVKKKHHRIFYLI